MGAPILEKGRHEEDWITYALALAGGIQMFSKWRIGIGRVKFWIWGFECKYRVG